MTTKIAVVVVHGIGNQTEDYYYDIRDNIKRHFAKAIGNAANKPADEVVLESAWWAPVLSDQDAEFHKRISKGGPTGFPNLRSFILHTAADAVAYQPISTNRVLYDDIHDVLARALNKLSEKAGDNAPLCIIAHSLGTIVVSNYIWDLQFHDPTIKPLISPQVVGIMGDTPLEKGETLAHLYTLGSPIALWSLRWRMFDYGKPIAFPSPYLSKHYPGLKGEWINFYDKDDVIGYPMKGLNKDYFERVAEDREVNVGNWSEFWNPLSHNGYWNSPLVYEPIAEALAKTWKQINAV